jgi:hypothetical protein
VGVYSPTYARPRKAAEDEPVEGLGAWPGAEHGVPPLPFLIHATLTGVGAWLVWERGVPRIPLTKNRSSSAPHQGGSQVSTKDISKGQCPWTRDRGEEPRS